MGIGGRAMVADGQTRGGGGMGGTGEGGLTERGQEEVVDGQPVRGDSGGGRLRHAPRPARRRHQGVARGAAAPLALLICREPCRDIAF